MSERSGASRVYWQEASGQVQMHEVGVRPLTLGTDACCAVVLSTGAPVHAAISREGGEVWIRSLSRAATLTINGSSETASRLAHGDRIACGAQELRYAEARTHAPRMLRLGFELPGGPDRVELDHPGSEIVIGRKGADVVVEDDSLSRHHLAIEHFGDEMLWVRDLDSTNGSRIAGKPMVGRVAITPGAVFHVGRVKVDVAVGEETPADLQEIPSRRVVFGPGSARA